ncbi:MAG: hypothetical protein Q8L39_04230 [Burkholderiales bacterium]|nr:hypothetical protein [Burkholderiales bacterium]
MKIMMTKQKALEDIGMVFIKNQHGNRATLDALIKTQSTRTASTKRDSVQVQRLDTKTTGSARAVHDANLARLSGGK